MQLSRVVVSIAIPVLLAGCGSMNDSFGFSKNAPDEFQVITKAPLIIPPDFNLRPPKSGETTKATNTPSETAQLLLLGRKAETPDEKFTPAEQNILKKAGSKLNDAQSRIDLENEARNTVEASKSVVERLATGPLQGNDAQ
jgi:hypothetical protein